MPPAARIGDMHVCPMVTPGTPPIPHVGGPISIGCPTVLIGAMPAARVGDMCVCVGPPDTIAMGSMTVMIGGSPAARMGDLTAHGGTVAVGFPTVMIGDMGMGGGGGPSPGAPSFPPPPPVPPFPPVPPVPPVPPIPSSDLTDSEAQKLFDELASRDDIAFKYPADGCYARAHLMVAEMQRRGLNPGKVWTFADGWPVVTDPLWVSTPNHPDGKVAWGYHVAPTVPVKGSDGVVRDMVVDPSMFDKPVTIDEWKTAQHDHPTVVQTKPGEPVVPTPGKPNTGYWPGEDPPMGPDAHAEDTMKDYKRKEGTGL